MPPKQVTCSICAKTVLKSQTLALKDGTRGCRSHEQVQAESNDLKQADWKRREQDKAPKKFPWHMSAEPYQEPEDMREWREHSHTHCWICDTEGVGQREFFTQVVIAMKRLELRGEFDFFNLPQQVKPLMKGLKPLFMIPFDPDGKDKGVVSRAHDRRIRGIVHFLRQLLLCNDCITKLGWDKRLKDMFDQAAPTWEQVQKFLPVIAIMDPILEKMALQQEEEN